MIALLDADLVPEGFTEMVHFLNATSIRYALTVNPTIFNSFIKQFQLTAKIKTHNGESYVKAIVDGQKVLVSELSIRATLLFADDEEIKCLSNVDIFKGLKDTYEKKNNSLKFQKALLYSHWKFLAHTLLHCLSPKTSGWNEFSTVIASAMIYLSKGVPFNFSNLILEGMIKTIKESGTYLLYPRGFYASKSIKELDLTQLSASQAKEINNLKKQVKDLKSQRRSRSSNFKRLKKVGTTQVVSSSEDAPKQGRNDD